MGADLQLPRPPFAAEILCASLRGCTYKPQLTKSAWHRSLSHSVSIDFENPLDSLKLSSIQLIVVACLVIILSENAVQEGFYFLPDLKWNPSSLHVRP